MAILALDTLLLGSLVLEVKNLRDNTLEDLRADAVALNLLLNTLVQSIAKVVAWRG